MRTLMGATCGAVLLCVGCFAEPVPPDCVDADGDGFGDHRYYWGGCPGGAADCDDADPALNGSDADADGYSTCDGDCDDADGARFPDNPEICDGLDNDCLDGVPDGESDLDEDGYRQCDGDCDDGDAGVHPDAAELCNGGKDDDCDATTGEHDDADGDGHTVCDGDCDEADELVNPWAAELCDGVDNDCDGDVDTGCLTCDTVVPGNVNTIQLAIEGADGGDVICVEPQTYTESLQFSGVTVSVVGLAGPTLTTIDAQGAGPVARFNGGSTALLQGFTLTGGTGMQSVADQLRGGGVLVESASPTLRRLVITGNEVDSSIREVAGGGVHLESSQAVLEQVVISGNLASSTVGNALGGGLSISGSSPALTQVEVSDNVAETMGVLDASLGGGIYMVDTSPSLENVVVMGNSAQDAGGGVYADGGAPALSNVIVASNEVLDGAGYGGGIAMISASVAYDSVAVLRNTSAGTCGGLYLQSGPGTLSHAAVIENNAIGGAGGGICLATVSGLMVFNTTVSDNSASSGGGYHCSGCSVDLMGCNTYGNDGGNFSGMAGGDSAELDPGHADLSGSDPLAWDLHLTADSDLVDAGFGNILDLDDSAPDIGIYGGAAGGSWDLDWDGFPEWWQPGDYDPDIYPDDGWDCDDRDPGVFPGSGC